MSKSDNCIKHINPDVIAQEIGMTADMVNTTKKLDVTRIDVVKYQTGQSYGDIQDLSRHTSHDKHGDQTKNTACLHPFTTDLKPKDAWVPPNKNVVITSDDNLTQKENIETAIGKSLENHFGVPSKKPTSGPSDHSKPQSKPSILVNGEWVNFNKRPCTLVRFKHRMARMFRRINRCYEEVMLNFVVLRAQRHADEKREEGLRQQNL